MRHNFVPLVLKKLISRHIFISECDKISKASICNYVARNNFIYLCIFLKSATQLQPASQVGVVQLTCIFESLIWELFGTEFKIDLELQIPLIAVINKLICSLRTVFKKLNFLFVLVMTRLKILTPVDVVSLDIPRSLRTVLRCPRMKVYITTQQMTFLFFVYVELPTLFVTWMSTSSSPVEPMRYLPSSDFIDDSV